MKKIEQLNLTLPFYGRAGTLGKITTIENGYYRYDYDADGHLMAEKFVPKSRGKDLKVNYYQDVFNYLQVKEPMFMTYWNSRLKKKREFKNIAIDAVVAFALAATGLTLSLLSVQTMPINWMTGVSIGIFSVSGVYCGMKVKELVDCNRDNKKVKFIQQYQSYQRKLTENNLSLAKKYSPPTEYQALTKENNQGNTLLKSRILKREI